MRTRHWTLAATGAAVAVVLAVVVVLVLRGGQHPGGPGGVSLPAASVPAPSNLASSNLASSGSGANDSAATVPTASTLAPSGSAASGSAAGGPTASVPAASGPADNGPADSGPADSGPADSGPAAGGPAAGTDLAESCTGAPLKSQLAAAVRDGASVIVAVGRLTGRSAGGDPATAGAAAFYALTLQSVQTLRGPAVGPGTTAWVPGPAPGTRGNPEDSALLAPGGRLFAIVWPKSATRYPVGPTLQLAPIVGADVVFTPVVCWNLTGLQPNQYQDSTALRSVPSGANFGGVHQAAENGLYTVPLATVRQVAAPA